MQRVTSFLLKLAALVAFSMFAVCASATSDDFKVEIVPQLPHRNSIDAVAFLPDGRHVVSGGFDGKIKLWDTSSGTLVRTLAGDEYGVWSVAISPDNRKLLSSGEDNTAKLWDVVTGALVQTFAGHEGYVNSAAFSPDGKFVATGSSDNSVKLWNTSTGKLIRTFLRHTDEVHSVQFSKDGRQILSGSDDKTIILWNVATGAVLRQFTGHDGPVRSVSFSPDGRSFASGSADNTLRIWQVSSGRMLQSITDHVGSCEPEKKFSEICYVTSVRFSPNGAQLLSTSKDKNVKLWDAATGTLIRKFEGHNGVVYSAAFAPDGHFILSGSDDGLILLFDVASGQQVRSFGLETARVNSVAIMSTGQQLMSAGKGITIWDAASGRLLRSFDTGEEVSSVAFSPDNRLALSVGGDRTLKLWDVATGALLRTSEKYPTAVSSVAFSPDGRFALSDDNAGARLWDVATGTFVRSFQGGHKVAVYCIAYSPDGRQILTGSTDTTIKLWDAATGKVLRSFEGHTRNIYAVAFSPDGRQILSGSGDDTLKLWDAASGRLLRTFDGYKAAMGRQATFAPGGKQILAGTFDGKLRIWDVSTGALMRTFDGHSDSIGDVAVSADGRRIVTASWDATVKIWNPENDHALATLISGRDGNWLAQTPEGFFAGPAQKKELLTIVRGLEVITIGQIRQSLFSPDLVRESLADDPNSEVKRAAEYINLEKVVGSGLAPNVEILSPAQPGESKTDLVTVRARVTDQGAGIGRMEWRVNGITVAVVGEPQAKNKTFEVEQQLALDPGDNAIEVIAYNGRNLLASLPASTTLKFKDAAATTKPKLHVLAIGINKYVDRGWLPPNGTKRLLFPPLGLAVTDAKALADGLKKAGAGLYGEIDVVTALDEQATAEKLDAAVTTIAARTSPRDTFVFFVAGHGYSKDGRFYLIPQDFDGGTNPEALAAHAIGQSQLQDWIANRIKAKKALILLDTCESGALTNGFEHSRVEGPATEAGVGRLHEATGRPVLTASAANQYAHEGTIAGSHQAHGIFTWALLDAMRNGDSNRNGIIELSEMVAHVQAVVPGLAAGLARAVADTAPVFGVQTPRFASPAEDFALVGQLK